MIRAEERANDDHLIREDSFEGTIAKLGDVSKERIYEQLLNQKVRGERSECGERSDPQEDYMASGECSDPQEDSMASWGRSDSREDYMARSLPQRFSYYATINQPPLLVASLLAFRSRLSLPPTQQR